MKRSSAACSRSRGLHNKALFSGHNRILVVLLHLCSIPLFSCSCLVIPYLLVRGFLQSSNRKGSWHSCPWFLCKAKKSTHSRRNQHPPSTSVLWEHSSLQRSSLASPHQEFSSSPYCETNNNSLYLAIRQNKNKNKSWYSISGWDLTQQIASRIRVPSPKTFSSKIIMLELVEA